MKTTGKFVLAAVAVAALSSGAMAADLSIPAPAAPVAAAPSTTNWDGPYIGATVGYGWGTATPDVGTALDPSGLLVGAQLGYNFHLSDQIVAGVQGNIDWNNENAGGFALNADGAITARLGVDVDSVLPYIEAGVAFANATVGGVSNTHTGWTAGVGAEFMLANQLSANVEYRYSDYGSQTYGGTSVHLTDNQIRVGLNYHF